MPLQVSVDATCISLFISWHCGFYSSLFQLELRSVLGFFCGVVVTFFFRVVFE